MIDSARMDFVTSKTLKYYVSKRASTQNLPATYFQIASTRIQTLVEATPEQLRSFNDVCAICYLDMVQSAKITPCGHYFHGRCLKKWLFLNDQCPMCQANVIEGMHKIGNRIFIDTSTVFRKFNGISRQ